MMKESKIVKPAESFAELVAKCKGKLEADAYKEKMSIQEKLEIGKLLTEINRQCEHGQWLPTLEKMSISSQRASEFIRVVKLPRAGVCKCDTWIEVMAFMKAHEMILSGGVDRDPGEEGVKAAESAFCQRCQRIGPVKDCAACAELKSLNKRTKGAATELEKHKAEEKGKKEEAKSQPKAGAPKFDWKPTDQYVGTLVRQVDLFGNAYKVKEHLEVDSLRKRLADWHADFKEVYERIAKQKAPEAAA
jgi:hypothetical protein